MKIDTDKVRELVSRREGPHLDFKRSPYPATKDGDAEFTKDLIAMANTLSPGTGPAYILIGVDEEPDGTGRIVGTGSTPHPKDSDLHQKVRSYLNRTPDFTYGSVEVEGQSVGVYEIRPGRRPFFALKDQSTRGLPRFGAVYRAGSSTDIASPDLILRWADEDGAWLRFQGLPDIEVRGGKAECVAREGSKDDGTKVMSYEWRFALDLFIIPATESLLVIPFHYCKARVAWTDGSSVELPAVTFRRERYMLFNPMGGGREDDETPAVYVSDTTLTLRAAAQVVLGVQFSTAQVPQGAPMLEASVCPVRSRQGVSISLEFTPCNNHNTGALYHWHGVAPTVE